MPRYFESQDLEAGGGLAKRTIRDRKCAFREYVKYAEEKLGQSVPDQFAQDPDLLSQNFTNYFWSMLVTVKVKFLYILISLNLVNELSVVF